MQQALEGVRVLDMSHALAGAACSNILTRYGAEVIKLERPIVGDDLRHFGSPPGLEGMSMSFSTVNAGKRSFSLDLKNPASREAFHRLVKRSDILVENFRPGVTRMLGADWETLRQINPRLVYCSVTGFGQAGGMRDRTAYDHIIAAASGLMWSNGGDEGPRRLGVPAIDTFSGYFAAVGVLAALHRRDATGVGEFIDVGMLDAAMTMVAAAIGSSLYTGEEAPRNAARAFRVVPTAGIYATADGHIDIGANHQHQVEHMFDVLNLTHLMKDERFATHAARQKNGEALHEILVPVFAARPSEELESVLNAVNVPAARVRSIGNIARHQQVRERRMLVKASANGNPIELMRGTPMLRGSPEAVGEVPTIGQHSEEILAELGFSDAEITALKAEKVV